jgi:glycosyltransferase involved in cell wall biosynthesis
MNNLEQLIKKSRQTPALAPIYAMELDRQLRGMAKAPLTFSAKGLADEATETARELGLDKLFDARPAALACGTIYQAELLAKEGKRSEAIVHAFENAQGPEVNALNLLYANHSTTNPKLRLHFLNKYLAAYRLQIDLEEGEKADFFHGIKCKQRLKKVDGPLVTVIMTARNAAANIELAVYSLIAQSWNNLQIIIVDDASTDTTLKKAKELAKQDNRIEILTTPVNAGPYVCRNLGVLHARGQFLTVHDADDWAFPDRIEQQVKAMEVAQVAVCTGQMLRVSALGQLTRPSQLGPISIDGYLRLCFSSLMVETDVFRKELGAWDTVWVGADSEMLDRIKVLQIKSTSLARPLMLCLDDPEGFTRDASLGLLGENGKSNELREEYKRSYRFWHQSTGSKKLEIDGEHRRFEVSPGIEVLKATVMRATEPDMSNPKHILINANIVASRGNHTRAISLAETHLPADLLYTVEILRANAALSRNDTHAWQRHVNAYLSKFNVAPIHLDGSGTVFDRLTAAPLTDVTSGPLISVIMPAWNAEKTVRKAAQSILKQTWRNLELLIVDDASTDGTWSILQDICASDVRVKVFRNKVNVGPYVSKNIALTKANGVWITGHDADDWAHPQRLEQHFISSQSGNFPVSITYMLRITEQGKMEYFTPIGSFSPDGSARVCSISALFNADFHKNYLGFWDSVRYGADSEMLGRAKRILGNKFAEIPKISMLCLELPTSLTNDPNTGVRTTGGLSTMRKEYGNSAKSWHHKSDIEELRMNFKNYPRNFYAPQEMIIDWESVKEDDLGQ